VRLFILGILCFTLFSCREYYPFDAPVRVTGYQISGKVISADGVPMRNASVKVRYYYDEYSATPLDTSRIIISGTPKYMVVVVVTPEDKQVKQLYAGYPSGGIFPRLSWNELNDSGQYAPSGKYIIRYTYGTDVVKETPYVAENHVTTTTDANGEFLLTNNALPIGEVFDIYDTDNPSVFYGAYKIYTVVRLIITKGNLVASSDVQLEKNTLTRRVFTLQ